jgi:hypothetical protein
MILHIGLHELEEPVCSSPYMFEKIYNLGIDYADNVIYGYYEDQEYTIFKFSDYGFINDNRFNTCKVSYGFAGVTIEITKTR